MSDWKKHLQVGILYELLTIFCVGFVLHLKNIPIENLEIIMLLPIFVIAPLLPDIDHRSSKITTISIFSLVVLLWIAYYFFQEGFLIILSMLSIVVLLSSGLKHRGVTHSYFFAGLITLLLFVSTHMVLLSLTFFVGYVSHIALDKR